MLADFLALGPILLLTLNIKSYQKHNGYYKSSDNKLA